MPIFTFGSQNSEIIEVPETKFATLEIRENQLQTALKKHIEAISPDTLIIAEEFRDWDDSQRRIDLLGIDRCGNIVVIELKRDDTGAYMDLQAIRYAAMVSTMNFNQAVDAYQRYLLRIGDSKDAESELRSFLGWEEEGQEFNFPNGVRIVLASADFSRELTTAVMWLNQRDLDIRCVRIKPYKLQTSILLDIEQIIPLPESQEYQIKLKQQSAIQKSARATTESRCKTRYQFNGESYGYHGKLVLAVVKKYCGLSEDLTLEKVQATFPRSILGFAETIVTKEFGEEIYQRTRHKRHFLNNDQVITIANSQQVVVSNQWAEWSAHKFIQHVNETLNWEIDIINDDLN